MNLATHSAVGELLDEFLSSKALPASDDFACPYLPEQQARSQGFAIDSIAGSVYRALLDRNFRRSGRVIYRPVCPACSACRQLRIRTAEFKPTRSQRRVLRRNADANVAPIRRPVPTTDKWELFHRYVMQRHGQLMASDYESFVDFLYSRTIEYMEFDYRLGDRLIGVSVADICEEALSSVYMFFDPDLGRRSLGTFSILWEIDYCRMSGIPYYYLGFHVAGARTMEYKARFKPHEVLEDGGGWRRVPR